jgi:hypothetical protein
MKQWFTSPGRPQDHAQSITAKACRMGLSILEVPISYSPRGRKEGKKIRWRDGLAAVWELWRWRKWRPEGDSLVASLAARPQAPHFGKSPYLQARHCPASGALLPCGVHVTLLAPTTCENSRKNAPSRE